MVGDGGAEEEALDIDGIFFEIGVESEEGEK